jgi:hypothetical protein
VGAGPGDPDYLTVSIIDCCCQHKSSKGSHSPSCLTLAACAAAAQGRQGAAAGRSCCV